MAGQQRQLNRGAGGSSPQRPLDRRTPAPQSAQEALEAGQHPHSERILARTGADAVGVARRP
jgi:hypothetical protein